MKLEKIISRAFNIAVVLILMVILGIALILVYGSFERSVKADIFLYTRRLEDSVRRVAATEYRRFFLLKDLGETVDFDDTDENLRSTIELKADIFSPEGGLPHLVSAMGYFKNEDGGNAFEYDFKLQSWRKIENIFNRRKNSRGFDMLNSGSEDNYEDLYLIIDKDGENGLFLKLDHEGFTEAYIQDNVEAIEPGLKFEWSGNLDESFNEFDENKSRIDPDKYSLKPFRILLGLNRDRIPLRIEIPAFFTWSDNRQNPDELNRTRPSLIHSGIFVDIFDDDGSYFHRIEKRASVNFVEILLFLIVLEVLFYLLISQLKKTRELRKKEREFVASVTHELRTPLTVIHSAADNLSKGIVPEDKLTIYAGLINEQSDRLGKMIEEILLYSKFESKQKAREVTETTELKKLITDLQPGLDAVAEAAGIRIDWDAGALPPLVKTHPEIINLVLNNLVTNAVNHAYADISSADTGSGAPHKIRVRIRYIIPNRLMVEVEDDGRGVERSELKHIFEAFYRDGVSRSRQEKGSGLGLFIARQRVIHVGGKINIESPYRRINGSRHHGCRFTLTLPCFIPEENSDGRESEKNTCS